VKDDPPRYHRQEREKEDLSVREGPHDPSQIAAGTHDSASPHTALDRARRAVSRNPGKRTEEDPHLPRPLRRRVRVPGKQVVEVLAWISIRAGRPSSGVVRISLSPADVVRG